MENEYLKIVVKARIFKQKPLPRKLAIKDDLLV